MPYRNRKSSYNNFILIFVLVKIALNTSAIARFGFQRDELLHLALADHLAWGYKEVQPFIAVLAKLSVALFGNSLAEIRILTTLCSALVIWLTGKITVEFGGKKFAIALTCLTMIFSPAFAATGYLFQPVVFDQLWWVLTVWLLIKYINTNAAKYLYFIGIAIGLGLLTKYTMAFLVIALIISLLITKQRRLLLNKHLLGAMLIAFLLFLPNLLWQFNHHFVIIRSMAVHKDQLEYFTHGDFISQQIIANGVAFFVWFIGLLFLVFSFKLRKFQFLAFTYILMLVLLIEMDGKSHYLLGAYPMLFAAGGFGFERWIKSNQTLRTAALILFTVPNLLLFPAVLPVLPLRPTLTLFDFINKHIPYIQYITIWEDQKHHATTQNYGDMFGWDEMTKKVADTYNSLTPQQKQNTIIYTGNYGEAGAIHHFGKQYNLPEPICLSNSFALWAPDSLNAQYIIYVDDSSGNDIKLYHTMLESDHKAGSVDDSLAVEKGTGIFLFVHPKPDFFIQYEKHLAQTRVE